MGCGLALTTHVSFLGLSGFVGSAVRDRCVRRHMFWLIRHRNRDQATRCVVGERPPGTSRAVL